MRSPARSRTVVQCRYRPKPYRPAEAALHGMMGHTGPGRRPPWRMAPNGRPAGCGPAPPGRPALYAIAQLPPAGIDHPLQSPALRHAEVLPWSPAQSPTARTTHSTVTLGIRQIGTESRNRCTSVRPALATHATEKRHVIPPWMSGLPSQTSGPLRVTYPQPLHSRPGNTPLGCGCQSQRRRSADLCGIVNLPGPGEGACGVLSATSLAYTRRRVFCGWAALEF
jgi:hypothetical protein